MLFVVVLTWNSPRFKLFVGEREEREKTERTEKTEKKSKNKRMRILG